MKKINICLLLFLNVMLSNLYAQSTLEQVNEQWKVLNYDMNKAEIAWPDLIFCAAMQKFIQPEQRKLNNYCKNNPGKDCQSYIFSYRKIISPQCPADMFYGYTLLREQIQEDIQATVNYMKSKAQNQSFEWRDLIEVFAGYKSALPALRDRPKLVLKFYSPEQILNKNQMFFLHIALDDLEHSSNIIFGQVNDTREEKLVLKFFKTLYGIAKINEKNLMLLNSSLFEYEQFLKCEALKNAYNNELFPEVFLDDLKASWFSDELICETTSESVLQGH